ncbi:hypothetical protein H2199_001071 [Coniosporium tulheliwenetii]|uniref:Uncharacterized protein n=1 Tax=Coniosporium tulheliwenetii TaxID=3383036 RepID=A0ACC2ZKY0_9PEZI|nr:hypothetical protein H2199_001071 [Cladosporium sp. JES 115]
MSRLLNLPAELRFRIYEYALTAPDAAIKIYFSFQSLRVKPNLRLSLLRTCKQIYHEACDVLYTKNTILIVLSSRDTCLPLHALQELRSVFYRVDCTFTMSKQLAKWTEVGRLSSLRAMTSLKSLRLHVIDSSQRTRERAFWTEMLACFVETVPKDCEIVFGIGNNAELAFARSFHSKCGDDYSDEVKKSYLECKQYRCVGAWYRIGLFLLSKENKQTKR